MSTQAWKKVDNSTDAVYNGSNTKGRSMKIAIRASAFLVALLLTVYSYPVCIAGPESLQVEPEETAAEENPELIQEVSDHVAETRRLARRTYFDGFCAAYVHWQLIAAGINSGYISGDAWKEFDKYRNLKVTTGGYLVEALPASSYTLREALLDLTDNGNRDVSRLTICFRYGTGSLARYGHVLYVYAIENGIVYYSESSDWKIGGVGFKAGTPICQDLETFSDLYAGFRFAGVLRFYQIGDTKPKKDYTGSRFADFNGDGEMSSVDYLLLRKYVANSTEFGSVQIEQADVDRNGRVSEDDALAIRYLIFNQ